MVLIPGFYEDVAEVTSKEMKLYDEIEFDITQYKNALGTLQCPVQFLRSSPFDICA